MGGGLAKNPRRHPGSRGGSEVGEDHHNQRWMMIGVPTHIVAAQ